MSDPGHVFVVHADLAKLACDHYLVPTDVWLWVTEQWAEFGAPAKDTPEGWGDDGIRVTAALDRGEADERRTVRWVNTGTVAGHQEVDWLATGLRQALAAAAEDLRDRKPRYKRARPLLGMPVFGVGAGGFSGQRGKVLRMLLEVTHDFARTAEFDIAFVCRRRSDYAALQSRPSRLALSAESLTESQVVVADDLGAMAREGRLVLFLGAGVSVPAGLPDWRTLLDQLAAHSGQGPTNGGSDLLDVAQVLRDALEEEAFLEALGTVLARPEHALGHGLLASLRVNEVVTTNFDDLYEQAVAAAFPNELRVLPWDRAAADAPWLLKMHGGIGRTHVVLTRQDFTTFDDRWRPVASIVQALLMTRHVLFVGYSLTDDNFVRLGRDVSRMLAETTSADLALPDQRRVGTVLSLGERPKLAAAWEHDMRLVAVDDKEVSLNGPGRRLEIFLDRIAAAAAAQERSYALDERYAELLPDDAARTVAAKLRDVAREIDSSDSSWGEVSRLLAAMGAR